MDPDDTGTPRLRLGVDRTDPGRTIVTLAGRFDAVAALDVRERMADDDLVGAGDLVFDLTDVSFLDSAGLAVLVRARQDRVREGHTVTLIRPTSEDAMRVLRLTRFDEIFTMVDDRATETI